VKNALKTKPKIALKLKLKQNCVQTNAVTTAKKYKHKIKTKNLTNKTYN